MSALLTVSSLLMVAVLDEGIPPPAAGNSERCTGEWVLGVKEPLVSSGAQPGTLIKGS